MFQDPKYAIFAVNRATGRAIPQHIPVMLFVAKDLLAADHAIENYAEACESFGAPQEQIESAYERLGAFRDFAANHPSEMKMPGEAGSQPVDPPKFPIAIDGHYTYCLGGGNVVQFVKPDENDKLLPGTTTEEVLEMLIDRIKTQDSILPCAENKDILLHLGAAIALQRGRMVRTNGEGVTEAPEKFGIRMHPCNSSNLASYGYRADTHVLALEFKGGRIYHYADVPEEVYNGLIESDSKGAYAHSHISTVFEGTRQEEHTQATA